MISDIGCSKVKVEYDCLELLDACNGKMDIRGPNSALLADCFHLAHGVTSISFIFCPREANGLAHFLLGPVMTRILAMFGWMLLLISYYHMYSMMFPAKKKMYSMM